jgi:hypothetical protein
VKNGKASARKYLAAAREQGRTSLGPVEAAARLAA